MSRATVRRMFTARRSPLVTADDFLRRTGHHILTTQHSVPVISDGLNLAAAASFAFQAPHAGPLANLFAAALATLLSRTQAPLPPAAAISAASRLALVLWGICSGPCYRCLPRGSIPVATLLAHRCLTPAVVLLAHRDLAPVAATLTRTALPLVEAPYGIPD